MNTKSVSMRRTLSEPLIPERILNLVYKIIFI